MSQDYAGIISNQNELFGKISRAFENLKKSGAGKITQGGVESRLQALEERWKKFENNHERLLALTSEEKSTLEYFKLDLASKTEEAFLTQRGVFLDTIRSFKASSSAVTKEESTTSNRTTLPRIHFADFSGNYEEWPAFKDLFLSLVSKDPALTAVDKLHYLKTCLKGEAELLIRDLSTTGENFERAWNTLCEYYENKRLLVRTHLANFVALPKMKTESAAELRKMLHSVKATVNSLDSMKRPITSSEDLFVYLTTELLDPRSRREWENTLRGQTEPPSFSELLQFLQEQLHTLESMAPAKGDSASNKSGSGAAKSCRSHSARNHEKKSDANHARCAICHKNHFVIFCEAYRSKTAQERKRIVEEKNLCPNCLGRHTLEECYSKKQCTACNARHHTSIHDACRGLELAKSSHVSRNASLRPVSVLLATARVRVADRHGFWHLERALIDQGSESSMISERLTQRLRLPRSSATVAVYGVGGERTSLAKGRVNLLVSSRSGGSPVATSALVLPRITAYAGSIEVSGTYWPHIQDLELADPEFSSSDSIDILLGAEVYASILEQGLRKGNAFEPVAQKTSLGWILSGPMGETTNACMTHSHQCQTEDDLGDLVRRFWTQEEAPSAAIAYSLDDKECEDHFIRTHSRRTNGRYVVRLPVLVSLPDLSWTRRTAERALKHMKGRFSRDPSLHALYLDFMGQYVSLGHMTPISTFLDLEKPRCYLPHHGVRRDASTTTKLRVVFNGSSTIPSGETLNQFLRTGPNLLAALADVLLRWRRHRFVIAADIEKMYRQIEVHPEDRDLQRILWRKDPTGPIIEYQLNTVTYGLACAPFLAIRVLLQLADDEEKDLPLGATTLRRDIYMDDVLTGASTIQAAKELQRQLIAICKAGCFPLKKWSANDARLLSELPAEDRLHEELRGWQSGESHFTLGLRWHPLDDCFSFSVPPIRLETWTKRSILSLTAKLFDPLGWLSPVSVRAKIGIQSIWLLGVDWDTELPDDAARCWREFQEELPLLETIRVPRWLAGGLVDGRTEIHGFADASERAYAAAVYLRTEDTNGAVTVRLIMAKTKVAPLKQLSIPRLELCAATLLVRVVAQVQRILEMEKVPLHLWSDSTVTLGWIRGHPTSWKTYVANRVSEIQTTLPDAQWHHIAGPDNPADCASRGLSPPNLVDHLLWWKGPSWLQSDSGPWTPSEDGESREDLPERRIKLCAAAAIQPENVEPELLIRFSRLSRLLRITAWCRRWRHRPSAVSGHDSTPQLVLLASELEDARLTWLRVVQAIHFGRARAELEKRGELPVNWELASLRPFLDVQGILRVGGRLRHSLLAYDQKHPAILPGGSHFTHLIVESCHLRTLHGGAQLTLGAIRQEYWIPRGRSVVKGCIRRCVPCLRWRAATPQPLMGDLPAARVTPVRPFLNTGLDYAGPVWLRTSRGRGHKATKAFFVIFVCLSSRAVHLDVASDYSTDAFLAALRRFIARRGLCQTLYSDCGTNFVGADNQLRSLFLASQKHGRRLAASIAMERIQWRFNPPAAPNFGGIWEAAVKSTKHHLRRVLGDATLTYEEMATLLAQVEACLNSRPLQALTEDPDDLAALTPGHFLIGGPLNAVPEPSLSEERTNRLSRWQLLQKMKDHFWDRWSQEYLHTLTQRPKWRKTNEEVRVGRLCLLRNEATPPLKWPLARIEETYPGKDGHVRVVRVRTANARLTRPVAKLVLLPVSSAVDTD